MRNHKQRARNNETRAIYRKADEAYAPYSCPSSGECCQLAKTKREPWLYASEWDVLLEHLESNQRAVPEDRADGGCPFLDPEGKRCTVYAARPFGCRTFFCDRIRGPARQPVEAVDALLRRMHALNSSVDDEAVRASQSASLNSSVDDEAVRGSQSASLNSPDEGSTTRASPRSLLEWIRVHRAANSRQG